MASSDVIRFRRKMSALRKAAQIKECFHHRKDQCQGQIKQSHSLQRNRRLSLLEGTISRQQMLYSTGSVVSSKDNFIERLDPIPAKKASTFFGFCDFHDTSLFSVIENNSFDNSDEHLFLHSYRSFAHQYHAKREVRRLYESNEIRSLAPDSLRHELLKWVTLAIKESNDWKDRLDTAIETRSFDAFDYLSFVTQKPFPVACSTMISPDYMYGGAPFNLLGDESVAYEPIILTVLPDGGCSIIILACLAGHAKAIQFLDELDTLPNFKLLKAVSSLMITYAENTFFSPEFYRSLKSRQRRILLDELRANKESMWTSFRTCRTNFFQ